MTLQADSHLDDGDFKLVQDMVYKYCGIALNDAKRALVQARIAREMRVRGYATAKEYLQHVLANRAGRTFAEFIDAISTNLTSFFREQQHYEFLLEKELPRLLAHKQSIGDGKLLVWSAACSSGEEPYSLTMIILDAIRRLPKSDFIWDVRVLATDISTRMLATARAGVYDDSRLTSVPGNYRTAFFSRCADGQNSIVSAELRKAVRFRRLNLIDVWPFRGPFDLIFCRNVMIYFDKPTQERLVSRFWSVLSKEGFLFTGHSESLTGIDHRFVNWRPSIYQKAA